MNLYKCPMITEPPSVKLSPASELHSHSPFCVHLMCFFQGLPLILVLISVSTSTVPLWSEDYLFPGNLTNSCYAEPYIPERVECVERLIALYYGDYFPVTCPNIANWIAAGECQGCPWDKINPKAITPLIARNLSRSKLFHPTEPSCSVSQYVTIVMRRQFNPLHLNFFGFAIPLFSAMFLAMSDARGAPTTPQVFRSRLKEPVYFVLLWILFFVGYGISIAGHEVYFVCDGTLSFKSLIIGDWVNLAMMLWTSLWRCRHLKARDRPEEVISCSCYRESILYLSSSRWNRRLVDVIYWTGPPLILLSVLYQKAPGSPPSFCKYGSYKFFTFGLLQYSKVIIGILAVGVYSLGPPRSLVLFYVRYLSLILILLLSVSLLFLMRLPLYDPQCSSTLIPHVPDCQIAGASHAELIAHSFSVALFGIAEPLRLGWPQRCKPQFRTEDTLV